MKKTITFLLPALNDLAKPGEKSSGAILAQHVDNIAKNKNIFCYDLLSSINRFGKKTKFGAHSDFEAFTK